MRSHFDSSSRTEVVARVIGEAARSKQEEDLGDRERLLYEIAERERAEEKLRELNQELNEMVRSREDLLAKTMSAYELKQTALQRRLDELEKLNEVICSFKIIPNCGTHGTSWRKTWCSESMESFGYSPTEVLNGEVTIFNTIVSEDLAQSLEDFQRSHVGADRLLCTHRFITRAGETRHLMDFIRLWPVDETGLGKCEMVAIDVTDWIPLIEEKIKMGWPSLPLQSSPK